jgi:hypothetical protein
VGDTFTTTILDIGTDGLNEDEVTIISAVLDLSGKSKPRSFMQMSLFFYFFHEADILFLSLIT